MTSQRRPFLTAEWRWLVMLSYDVEPALLAPLVPGGTELDLWNGRALVSVVGFRFLDVCVRGVPVPFHRAFDEVNLRFYTRRTTPDGETRHGVTFIRELVTRPAVSILARLTYNEPYRTVRMRSTAPAVGTAEPGRCAYAWRHRGAWEHLAATAAGTGEVPPDGSEAAFITRHYWGYTRQRDGGTVEYRVTHPDWRVWGAIAPQLSVDPTGPFGAFDRVLGSAPTSAFIADGSAVAVYPGRRLDAHAARP